MPLFKSFRAPSASVSLNIGKDTFVLGETIPGELFVTSQEQFEAQEIRVELVGVERIKAGGEAINGASETPETRLYSTTTTHTRSGSIREYLMYRGRSQLGEKTQITSGYNQQFSFSITVPGGLGPTFQGVRRDGQWLERIWTLKGVVSVGGRPDVDTKKELFKFLSQRLQLHKFQLQLQPQPQYQRQLLQLLNPS